jgi:protein-S-isoprenylcysteine O-methyltransferase Ste14
VQIGPLKLSGMAARLVVLAILGTVVALVVWSGPRPSMLASAGIWLGFVVYWSAAGKGVAPTKRVEDRRSSARHQGLRQIGLLLLFIPVPGLTIALFPGPVALIGLAIQLAGAFLYLRAKRELGRAWSSEISVKQDQQLVRTGPYRLVRHPLYTAMLVMSAGTMIVSNQVHAVLGVAFMAGAYWMKIGIEERWMREEFGTAYDDYRRSSRAVIPWIL